MSNVCLIYLPCRSVANFTLFIHPNGAFKEGWGYLKSFACLVCILLLPIKVAYDDDNNSYPLLIVDAFFAIDAALNFITGYRQDDKIITNKWLIGKRYLK